MAAPASDSGGDVAMDPALWGNLQHRIDLSVIYAKLPLAPFFRLRLVCKEWNRLASDRQFLEQTFRSPITEPFFVVPSGRAGARLLTSQGSSWNSEPVPRGRHEVSGLLLVRSMRVFDLHTRVFHSLPPLPAGGQLPPLPKDDELGGEYGFRLIGMTVDKTLVPYRFRVVIGGQHRGTCIFDSSSGAWTQKPSTFEYLGKRFRTVSCFLHRQILFFNVGNQFGTLREILTYDFERDEWGPSVDMAALQFDWTFGNLGLWRERWFVLGVKNGPEVTVREVNPCIAEPNALFDTMPEGVCAWMMSGSWVHDLQSNFCGEHVVVYNWVGEEWRGVLYNLERKSWDRIKLPALPMSPWKADK